MTNQFTYKGDTIQINYEPRAGVCNLCRSVLLVDCEQTYLHHESYHDNNPIKDTIEVCTSCHKKIHAEWKRNQGLNRDVTIRVRSWTKDKLKDYGTSGNDNDDVIFILMQDHDELKKLRAWLKENGIKAPEWKREE